MYISSLTLKNFRNYTDQTAEFSPLTNVIYGNNAQGKTNILEALYLFSQGRSHRAKTDRELIKFGEDMARLDIEFHDNDRDYKAVMLLEKNGRKSIRVNHIQLTKLSMLMNYLNIVMFSPEDLNLIKGSPGSRRRFIDAAISQLYPSYLASLNDYKKALIQKNSLLKDRRAADRAMISVWNEQLADNGSKIMKARSEFVELLNGFAGRIQNEISGEKLEITYAPSIKCEDASKDGIMEYLDARMKREIEFSSALFGVQRDDLKVVINESDARLFGSQGQQRTATLAMKMALSEYIHHVKGEYPVLLLDDIMSELDITRRTYLAEKIRDKQVFITSTDTDLVGSTDSTKLFRINNGEIFGE